MNTNEKIKKGMFNYNKDKVLTWGILGTASIAQKRMIQAFQQSKYSFCYAIASRSKEKAEHVANQFGIEKFYDNYLDLINDDRIDAIYIPLPNSLHFNWSIMAAEKGKHILCEKPLFFTSAQLKELHNLCRSNGVFFLEAHSYFFQQRYQALLDFIKKEQIGQVTYINSHFSFTAEPKHKIRLQPKLGGGCLLDIGCYTVDLLNRLFPTDQYEVTAQYRMKHGVDMDFIGVVRYETGVEALIHTSFRQQRDQTLHISGTKGDIFLPDAFVTAGRQAYMIIKKDDECCIERFDPMDQYLSLVDFFADCVLSDKINGSGLEHYLRNEQLLTRFLELR